jgi:pimeloyl-ACP methyl ester carboxylesterase
MFAPLLPAFAEHREVIAVDLHGHGRTRLGTRRLSVVDQGDDLADLLSQLGHGQVDVLGYSLGASVAFRLAVQHPEKVRRLVLGSTGFAQDGFFPEILPMQAQLGAALVGVMKETPMYRSYIAVAPDPGEFPELLDRMGELMRTPYDWRDDVKKLAGPVMLVYADHDTFRLEHEVEFFRLLGGGLRDAGWQREHMSKNRLAILPGLTHYNMFLSPTFVATVLPFLDETETTTSWAALVRAELR